MHYISANVPLIQVSYDTYEEPKYHYAGSAEIHDCVHRGEYDHVISAWSHKPFVIVTTFANGDIRIFRSQPMPFVKSD